MARIEISEEETQALIDKVLDRVEKGLAQRLESDLYRSVGREASKQIVDRLAGVLREKALEYYTKDKLDSLLDRALQDRGYGTLNYALLDLAQQAQQEIFSKFQSRIEASMRGWMKEGE